jgi:drug/metabolite transporter (DMT)-like permease
MTQSASPPTAIVRSGTPAKVWLGLAFTVILDAPVQLTWKAVMLKYGSSTHASDPVSVVQWFLRQDRFWLLIGCFLVQFVNWMWVLSNADLSFAQPFTALSYVAVSGCAAFYFHEHVGPLRIVGIVLVLIGVMFVASSPHRTAVAGREL